MKSYSKIVVTLFTLLAAFGRVTWSEDRDPYEPLKLYDGKWQVRMGGPDKKPDTLVDHCVRTGKFFSCEQELNGEARALVIFLPAGTTPTGALEYRTLVVRPDAKRPDDWEYLVIEGDTWTYTWTQKDGGKDVSMCNVNHFTGKDHIHFEVQKLEDGTKWKTQVAGDEERAK